MAERYLEIDTGPPTGDTKLPMWVRLLQKVLPSANPDLEQLIGQAQVWWLEVDDDGEPLREIGFDPNGQAIVLGPVEGNFGFLIDAGNWNDSTQDSLRASREFDAVWTSLWPRFADLDERNR